MLRKIDKQWTAGQFIYFHNQGRRAKGITDLIMVTTDMAPVGAAGNEWLGEIKWFGRWRRYCFYPNGGTIFEQDCLRDIAEYLETVTKEHRAKRTNERLVSQRP